MQPGQRAAADPLGAYQEIFGLGEAKVTLRLLTRRCGPLADALLDFQGPADLANWLAQHT